MGEEQVHSGLGGRGLTQAHHLGARSSQGHSIPSVRRGLLAPASRRGEGVVPTSPESTFRPFRGLLPQPFRDRALPVSGGSAGRSGPGPGRGQPRRSLTGRSGGGRAAAGGTARPAPPGEIRADAEPAGAGRALGRWVLVWLAAAKSPPPRASTRPHPGVGAVGQGWAGHRRSGRS